MQMDTRHSLNDTFYIVFAVGSEDETFDREDFCEETFTTREEAEEYAASRVSNEGVTCLVVCCVPVAAVEVPPPVIREINTVALPAGTKPPTKPKSVIK